MIFALALTGPTASGKTALSIELAKKYGCEIVCCDSMQIYKDMNIGTAKATAEEQRAVRHHMIDLLSPGENYSAQAYREDAMKAVNEIVSRGKLPLFVGGTGLYIDTVIRGGTPESPPSDPSLHLELLSGIKTEDDVDALWQRLYAVDPASAEKIHKNNIRRVARALEIYLLSGKTKSYFDNRSKEVSPDIKVGMITLDFYNRENLYARVNARVDEMVNEGLEAEVRALYGRGLLDPSYTSAQAIGYKEMLGVIRAESTLADAIEQIKLSSRRYAKRQLTWFRHEADACRLYVDGEDGVMKNPEELVSEAASLANRMIEENY